MSEPTSPREDGITRICCMCGSTGADVTPAATAEQPSGPPIEYWACRRCKPVVESLGLS